MDSPASVEFSKPRFCLVFFLLLLSFHNLPCASSNPETDSCDRLFECGNITVGFPFWGENRHHRCGLPFLKLQCEGGSNTALLEFSSVWYHVLHINDLSRILKLARVDLSSFPLCNFAGRLLNDTLPPQLFEHLSSYKNLTVFHDCDPRSHYHDSSTCGWSDRGPVHQNPEYSTHCQEIANVTVPASFLPDEESWSLSLLESVLKEGFEVRLKVTFDQKACQKCSSSGGSCDFEPSKGFICNRNKGKFSDSD